MKTKQIAFFLSASLMIICSSLFAADFTVSSYNCGGLSEHYDYIRSVCMHKLAQERHNAEPEQMAQLERIQNLALKILFSSDPVEQEAAQQEWEAGRYADTFARLTAHPDEPGSINRIWRERSEAIVTSYKERPVLVFDDEVRELLRAHVRDLTKGQDIAFTAETPLNEWIDVARRVMGQRIFQHQLKYDIIALQEADYLDASMFPAHYEVLFSEGDHLPTGVAWNQEKFALVRTLGTVAGRGLVVELRALDSGRTVAIASAHLSGCNPFQVTIDTRTGKADASKGDNELLQIIEALETSSADIKIIAMDSNVTAAHPRLSLLQKAGYALDSANYLEPTCTNPWQVINTRIDWIAVKSSDVAVTAQNIPVLGVGLNSPQTNMSDHKPIAARVRY